MDNDEIGAFFARIRNTPRLVASTVGDVRVYLGLLIRSRNLHIATALFTLFALASFFSPFDSLYLVVTFALVAIEVLLSLAYLPAFLAAFVSHPVKERDQLIMGIWIAWNFDLGTRVWALIQRYSEDSDWMMHSHLLTFLLFGRMLAAMLHITAPDAADGRVARGTWVRLGLAFLAGVVVATALIYLTAGKSLML